MREPAKRLKQINFAWDIHPSPACLAENYDAAYHLGKKGYSWVSAAAAPMSRQDRYLQ